MHKKYKTRAQLINDALTTRQTIALTEAREMRDVRGAENWVLTAGRPADRVARFSNVSHMSKAKNCSIDGSYVKNLIGRGTCISRYHCIFKDK